MPSARQTSFSGGELSPFLWGRTDLPMFGRGARTMLNFFPTQQGAAASRPGTTYVDQVKAIAAYVGGGTPDRPYRLVPFVAGDGATYALQFGEYFIRFHTLGGTVVDGGGNPYEVATQFAARELWKLRFAQVGDVLTIVGGGQVGTGPAYELRRNGHTAWTITDVQFARPETRYADVDGGTRTSGFGIVAKSFGGVAPAIVLTRETEDDDHAAREWQWIVTSIIKDTVSGATFETLGDLVSDWWSGETASVPDDYDDSVQPITSDGKNDNWVLFPDKKITLRRAETVNPGPAPDTSVIAYNIYRGRGEVFGWVGQTKSREFVDVGEDPDYSRQPPRGQNPFLVPFPPFANAVMRPFSVSFFQERRCYGGAGVPSSNNLQQPGVLFASATGDYFDHDLRLVKHVEGEALLFELAARQHERIEHLLGLDRLLAFTGASVWTIEGGNDSPLDFNHVFIRRVDSVGAGDVPPLEVDGSALFIRRKGFGARAIVSGQNGVEGFDISQHAEHLFTGPGKNVVDWAHQEDPWNVVWAVRADGTFLSLTFSRERQLMGWAQHAMKYYDENGQLLEQGFVESICAVPEGQEDAVYLVVRRDVGGVTYRFIERMTSRIRRVKPEDPDPEYVDAPTPADTDTLYPTDVCLDCAIAYAGVPTLIIPGLDPLVGKHVYLVARGMPLVGPFLNNGPAVDLSVLLGGEVPAPNAVDGAGVPIFVCHVGLAFTADLETLDIAHGDARLRKKTVERIGFEVDNAIGVKAGQDFDHLDDFQVREVGDDYDPVSPSTALIDTPVRGAWDQSARAVLRQDKPLPITVVGLTRELSVGE